MVDGCGEKKEIVGMVGTERIVVGMEESSGGSATSAMSAYVFVCKVATVKNWRLYRGRRIYYSLNRFLEFKD